MAMAEGPQSGVLYINMVAIGVVRYDVATLTYAPTGVHMDGTAFGSGGDGFWYANGGDAAPRQLYRLRPEDPEFPPELVGVGARRIEDVAADRDGTLYGVGEGFLYRINRTNAEQTDIGPIEIQAYVDGLAFSSKGDLLTADGTHLMRLNTTTALATLVVEFPWAVRDLASDPDWLYPQPQTVVGTVQLSGGGVGVSVAANCSNGNLYYTNATATGNDILYTTNRFGAPLAQVHTVDAGSGLPIELNELAWDCRRLKMWAGARPTAQGQPLRVFLLDPATGMATFQFNGPVASISAGCCLIDGIAYDETDDTLWLSGDLSQDVYHYDIPNSFAQLPIVTPQNATNTGPLGLIRGIEVGNDGTLYVLNNANEKVYRVAKVGGTHIGLLGPTTGSLTLSEGLEIDPFSYAPTTVLWVRRNVQLTALEVAPGSRTCCGCCGGFKRGDADCDGCVDEDDAQYIRDFLFTGGPPPCCLDTADVNDDGQISVMDYADLSGYVSSGIPVPPAPGPIHCGSDPTSDNLTCVNYPPASCAVKCCEVESQDPHELASGSHDNFSTFPDSPAAAPSTCLTAWVATQGLTLSDFDDTTPNRAFAHTFELQPGCICAAQLKFSARALPGFNPNNDTISLELLQPGFAWRHRISLLPPSVCVPPTGGTWTSGQTVDVTLDLANLPVGQGVTNILCQLTDGDLDVYFQNATAIDDLLLIVNYCPKDNGYEYDVCDDIPNPPGLTPTTPRPALTSYLSPQFDTSRQFDEGGCGKVFTHSICVPGCICEASLKICMRAQDCGDSTNDTIGLELAGTNFAWILALSSPALIPHGGLGHWNPGDSTMLCLDLSCLPQAQFPNIIQSLKDGWFDIFVADDTLVDSVRLDVRCCTECSRPPTGLVGWWTLDEDLGTTASDIGWANHGMYKNGPVTVCGKVDRARQFNGSGQYVTVPDSPSLNFADSASQRGDFSIDAWIKSTPSNTGTRHIVDKRTLTSGVTRGYVLFLSNGLLGAGLRDGVSGNISYISNGPDLNTLNSATCLPMWHHVAVTVDRDSPTGGKLYVDGAVVTIFDPTIVPQSLTNTEPLTIGRGSISVGSGPSFEGLIDEVEIFRRALCEDEIRAIYSAHAEGKCKERCKLPGVNYCFGKPPTQPVSFFICNDSPTAQTYSWSLAGLPPEAGCPVSGATAVFTPAAGSVTVPPGACLTVPVTITKPTGLSFFGALACYQLRVTNVASGHQFLCKANLRYLKKCIDPKYPPPGVGLVVPVTPGAPSKVRIDVTAPEGPGGGAGGGVDDELFEYQVAALPDGVELSDIYDEETGQFTLALNSPISLNGMGNNFSGSLSIPSGQGKTIDIDLELTEDGNAAFDLVLLTDIDGDGVKEVVAEVPLRAVPPPPEGGRQLPGDCNQDGKRDISDAVCLLKFLFLGTPAALPCGSGSVRDPGNVALMNHNGDSGVDISDGIGLLTFLFNGGPPPSLGLDCAMIEGCPDNDDCP